MGISGISPWSLIIILLIIILLFGTKKLRNIGSDLGETLRNLKKGLNPKEGDDTEEEPLQKTEELNEPLKSKSNKSTTKNKS